MKKTKLPLTQKLNKPKKLIPVAGYTKEEYAEQVEKLKHLDNSLCFVCQEATPTHRVTSTNGVFTICTECAEMVESETRQRQAITRSLAKSKLFTYTLGIPQTYCGPKVEKL
jgi:hypothetical protein